MKKIQVCMGSACHLNGAPLVVQAFQAELNRRAETEGVIFELMGSFCRNQCLEGVLVKVDGTTYTRVKPADVPGIIDKCLMEGE